jgi:hypothetical protein
MPAGSHCCCSELHGRVMHMHLCVTAAMAARSLLTHQPGAGSQAVMLLQLPWQGGHGLGWWHVEALAHCLPLLGLLWQRRVGPHQRLEWLRPAWVMPREHGACAGTHAWQR